MGINVDNLMKDGDKPYAILISVEGGVATLGATSGTFTLDAGLVTVKQGGRVYFDNDGNVVQQTKNEAKATKGSTSGSIVDRNHALAHMAQ